MKKSVSSRSSSGSNFGGVTIAVEYVDPNELKPPHRTLRKRNRKQDLRLQQAITDFGFVNPVVVDSEGRLIAGVGRVEAAKAIGLTSIPIIRVEHLTEAQQRLFAIADNETPRGVEYIPGALVLELKDILLLEPTVDLTSSGLSIFRIDTEFGRARTEELAEADDELPEPDAQVVNQPGDCWKLKSHTLGCGDARDASLLNELCGDRKARTVLTDSPWNLKIEGVVSGKGKKKHLDFVMGAGEMSDPAFVEFLQESIAATQPVLLDGALLYMFIDWRSLQHLVDAAIRQNLVQKNLLVWCKDNAGLGGLYRSQHELIALFKHGRASHLNNVRMGEDGRSRSNVLMYPGANTLVAGRSRALSSHPTSKPVSLLADILLDVTAPGDLVLDTFGGAGSTLIAAERMGRDCCMVELHPPYVDGIIRRFEALTQTEAVHVQTGLTFAELGAQRQLASDGESSND